MDSELLQKYIAGHASEAEKHRVTQWIAEDEEHLREYRAQRRLYDITMWRGESDADCRRRGTHVSLQRRMWIQVAGMAAALVLAWMGMRSFYPSDKGEDEVPWQSIYVPAGQRAELTLADGSRVWLNARSRLSFPGKFSGESRTVKLDGEGYFAVAKKPEQPFVVETSRCHVKALGTEFNLLAYEGDSVWEAALLEGKVELLPPDARSGKMRLEPNTMAAMKGNCLVKSDIRHRDHFLWREGLICFNNITVREMMEKLQLYYGVDIVLHNRSILDNRYTGKFRTKDGVEHVLKVLRLSNRFRYEKDDEKNQITIY